SNHRLDLATDAQVVVERQDDDRRVARVAPLRAASVLDEPVSNRLDQLVLRIDREQRAQDERSRFDTTVRPTPVKPILAPVRRSHHRRILRLCTTLHYRR